jgi:hypothetical protein
VRLPFYVLLLLNYGAFVFVSYGPRAVRIMYPGTVADRQRMLCGACGTEESLCC